MIAQESKHGDDECMQIARIEGNVVRMGEPSDLPYRAVQIREVPGDVVDVLQARAAKAGLSLTTYLRNHLVELARKPTMTELYERSRRRDWGVDRATIVSAVRDLREDDE
ncbi:hypothetical protein GCM10022267_52570 [Lentzea roselyniae]|uniref:Ribbon-helix-helix protein, copG family n=2 Tax=Pseudonocardiaceae TaxID=2070 RepID=A0ABP7BI00_9PSEU